MSRFEPKSEEDKENKILLEQTLREKVFDDARSKLMEVYESNTELIMSGSESTNNNIMLQRNQDKEIDRNNIKLIKLQNDILLIRRQIESNENSYVLKTNKLFILKNVFHLLMIVIVIILLKMNGSLLPANFGKHMTNYGVYNLLIGAVCLFYTAKILITLYFNRNSNNIVSTKYDWVNPTDEEKRKIDALLPDPNNITDLAQRCSPGSHRSKLDSSKCELNICSCPNGVPDRGEDCPWDSSSNLQPLSCKSCISGYNLKSKKCLSSIPGNCPHANVNAE